MAFSKVMIIGNLGRDPEMRYTPNGRQVTEFSVAVTHRGRDQATGEWADLGTDWFRVTVWGDRAERAAEDFRKGNRVFVEGRFRTREYDAKDGTAVAEDDEIIDAGDDDLPSVDDLEDDVDDALIDESESEAAPAAID